jgi:hypothetical protein
MSDPIILLRCAYFFNIIFFGLVCYNLIFGKSPDGKASNDNKGISLIASAWMGIIFCSILGLFYPTQFWNILFFQTSYQFFYLLFRVFPLLIQNRMDEIQKSLALLFGCTCMAYSIILTIYWFSGYPENV